MPSRPPFIHGANSGVISNSRWGARGASNDAAKGASSAPVSPVEDSIRSSASASASKAAPATAKEKEKEKKDGSDNSEVLAALREEARRAKEILERVEREEERLKKEEKEKKAAEERAQKEKEKEKERERVAPVSRPGYSGAVSPWFCYLHASC